MMHMTFYWGKEATILFDGWKTSTWSNYGLSLLALFFASFFYQYLTSAARSPSSSIIMRPSPLSNPLLSSVPTMTLTPFASKILSSALFGFRVGIAYLLMLAVMSFNSGVFIAVVFGFTVGYYVFSDLAPPPSSAGTSLDDVDLCCS